MKQSETFYRAFEDINEIIDFVKTFSNFWSDVKTEIFNQYNNLSEDIKKIIDEFFSCNPTSENLFFIYKETNRRFDADMNKKDFYHGYFIEALEYFCNCKKDR